MTPEHQELCEKLNEDGQFEAAALIESQAKRIAEMERAIQHEATAYDKTQAYIDELEAQLERSESAVMFAGLVLKQHRNDGYPGDVDGDFLQSAALKAGLIEEHTVAEPCGERCSCAEALSESEFPTVCYFNTEAGKAAIASRKEQS